MKIEQMSEIIEQAFLIFEVELENSSICFKKLDEALDYKNLLGGKIEVKQVYTYKNENNTKYQTRTSKLD